VPGQGENGGFAQVALPHLDAAYNLARWLMRDPVAAEDVVQDAVVRALTYFASFRGTNPCAWLLQIVRTTAYSRLAERRAGVEESLDAGECGPHADLAEPGADPEAALAHSQGMRQLEGALAELPMELRECLVLRELEELSYRDIARIVGVPIGTVMSRLFRARQALLRHGQEAMKERE
jgi:RNA polymerase sigma-70 factor (ECF subfamily)